MIPRAALALGLLGLLPFGFGALLSLSPGPFIDAGRFAYVLDGLSGPRLLVRYGIVILCFMSGVLWGFAARSEPQRPLAYMLSVLPALWVFFLVGPDTRAALASLLTGFVLLLVFDLQFRTWGLAPDWWMRLRVLLTAVVAVCLGIGLYA